MEELSYTLSIHSKDQFEDCCIPFIKNDGYFIKTPYTHKLGDIIKLNLDLPNKTQCISAKVVWLNPRNSQDRAEAGIGVQAIDETSLHDLKGYFDAH